MAQKELKTRIMQKSDTETNWNKATNFIPLEGEIIIYEVDSNHTRPRIKIGDGISVVGALPFYEDLNKVDADVFTNFQALTTNRLEEITNSLDNISVKAITTEEIETLCNTSISLASEVQF